MSEFKEYDEIYHQSDETFPEFMPGDNFVFSVAGIYVQKKAKYINHMPSNNRGGWYVEFTDGTNWKEWIDRKPLAVERLK